jgi:Protein of unknown function (DUF3611)
MMLQGLRNAIKPSKGKSLARAFYRLGWAGFWFQVVFGSFPVIVMLYYFAFSRSNTGPSGGLRFIEYLTIIDLLMLLFTIFWSYHYTRLAKKLSDPERRPSESSVVGSVWTGVMAGTAGVVFSMIVVLIEALNLLFYFLKAPQGGMPVIQTSGTEAVHWVSAVDMVSIVALLLTLMAEQIALVFSLWLLFRTSVSSPEFPQTTDKA